MSASETKRFWKNIYSNGLVSLHIQKGMTTGIELIYNGKLESKLYSPLSDEEHKNFGYVEIDSKEIEDLLNKFSSELLLKNNTLSQSFASLYGSQPKQF